MSIFHRVPKNDVKKLFQYKGWLGICPVWASEKNGDVTERNWVPEWFMSANIYVVEFFQILMDMFGLETSEGWPVYITGEI